MHKRLNNIVLLSCLIILLSFIFTRISFGSTKEPISLFEAEKIALRNQSYSLQARSLTELINDEGRSYPAQDVTDTHLEVGVKKITTGNTPPWWKQDESKVVNIGVKQAFGAGDPIYFASERSRTASEAAYYQQAAKNRDLLNEVRNLWLSLFYLNQLDKLLGSQQASLLNLKNFPNAQQQLNPELESLSIQQQNLQVKIAQKRVQLGRLIGKTNANRPLDEQLPLWPEPPPLHLLKSQLLQHPKLEADRAVIRAKRAQTAFNKQQQKAKFEVTANYGMLQQDAMEAHPRLDMLSAQVDMKLPSQGSRRPGINTRELEAAQLKEEHDYQALKQALITQYDLWLKTAKQLYTIKPMPNPEKNQSVNIQKMIKFYQDQFDYQLQQLSIEVENAKMRSNLFYFQASKT